jgi:hypothetical protein
MVEARFRAKHTPALRRLFCIGISDMVEARFRAKGSPPARGGFCLSVKGKQVSLQYFEE